MVWRIKWKTVSIVNKGYSSTAAVSGQQQGNTSIQQWTSDYRVVDKIILPTQIGNLSYTFNYNTSTGWAEVSSVVMPADTAETPPQVAYQYTYPGGLANGLPKCTNILRGYTSTKTLTWQAQADGTTTATTETTSYDIGSTLTYITAPNGGVTTELHGDTSYPAPDGGLVKRIERPDGSKTERLYALNPQPWLGSLPPPLSERNAFVKTEFHSIKNAGGSYVKTVIKDFAYDKNGNMLQVTEYDWVDYSSVPKDASDLPTGIPGGLTPKRVSLNTYNNATPDSTTPGNHANAYWNTVPSGGYTTLVLNAVAATEIRPTVGGAVQARTEYTYDNPATTANLTEQRSWDSSKGALGSPPLTTSNAVITTSQYTTWSNGATGKPTLSKDANGNVMRFFYDDIGNGTTNLYPTKTITGDNDAGTSSVKRTAEAKYDFYTGAVTEAKDTDNNVITKMTLDVFGRPTLVQEAFGTAVERRTATEYSDTLRRIIVRSDKDMVGDGKLISVQHYDQLGRVRLSRKLESGVAADATDETKGVKVQARYFAGDGSNPNSYRLVSNPYRATTSGNAITEASMGWTRTKSDQGGRLIEAQTFGGASLPVPWGANTNGTGAVLTAYDAEKSTVTDQAGKMRRSVTDGLGRMASVIEDPAGLNYQTDYQYDALSNLVHVTQGAQHRYFMYTSLSRLLRTKNPEQTANSGLALADPLTGNSAWSMGYTYDNSGNLVTRTDANNLAATYTYDALNRNIYLRYNSYATGTAAVDLVYDSATNGKGRLNYTVSYNSRWDADGKPYWHADVTTAYDALGRPTNKWQGFILSNAQNQATTWQPYNMARTYNLAGMVTAETYPSGRTVNYSYDSAGRTSSFTGNIGDGVSRNYATGITYNEAGLPTYEVFGATANLYHKRKYNSRYQLYDVRLSNVAGVNDSMTHGALQFIYDTDAFEGIHNNGNVVRADSWALKTDGSGAWLAQYDRYYYDGVNRLTQLYESGNNSANTTDVFRFQQVFTYDRWGNRSIDQANTTPSIPGLTNQPCVIDTATNRMTSLNSLAMSYDNAGNQTNDGSYARWYDAENKLSKANSSGGLNYYHYDAGGKRVRRVVGGQETWQMYGFGGELVAEYNLSGTFTGSNPPVATSPTKEYGYRNGQMLVAWDSTETDVNQKFKWLVTDHLGSTRMEVGGNGSLTTMRRHDYAPFGEELQGGQRLTTGYGYTTAGVREKFTGKERDTETGLDYFLARYYGSTQGRFTSPDPIIISDKQVESPQLWNLYSYVGNNPICAKLVV